MTDLCIRRYDENSRGYAINTQYEVVEKFDSVVIKNVRNFNPVHIFECGQCFRWIKQSDGSYTGVVKNRVINIKCSDGSVEINNSSLRDFYEIWYDYFDLGRDYSKIISALQKDEVMSEALRFGSGIRLIRQDIWEVLISFIISANNQIPRIMKIVERLSSLYGNRIEAGHEVFGGETFFSFPNVDELYVTDIDGLNLCRAGFRCKYIMKVVCEVKSGRIDLGLLKAIDTDDAREELMKLAGVGPKVADCVLLFSGTKYDVFPTDVWVKRVMEELYFKRECTLGEIKRFAEDYFGELAGFAQQYLFYYARENGIGL